MAGHLFVIRGDLNLLECDLVLLPCDAEWNVVWGNWSDLLPEDAFILGPPYGARLREPGGGAFVDVASGGRRRIRLVVTADDHATDASRAVGGVRQAITDLRGKLGHVGNRVKPLVALPLVGTGEGGFLHRRGALIEQLLPALRDAAHEADLDVALVLRDERDHAAVQALRDESSDWPELGVDHRAAADRLGRMAARQELSLFLGAGVSVPLGLPDWNSLLAKVSGEIVPDTLTGEQALELAQRARANGGEALALAVRDAVSTTGCAPSHYLLAGLRAGQNVTTNYDTAYERALDTSLGESAYRVLTRHLAEQPHPWVLKIHGDAEAPETIVLTKDDYHRLESDHRALLAVVESLLMTSHLLFVGYSLKDPDFTRAVERVHQVRALARTDRRMPIATVLALHPGGVHPHEDLDVITMLDEENHKAAARCLEILLDRLAWSAAVNDDRSHLFLLDDAYNDLVEANPADRRLKELLVGLGRVRNDDPGRDSRGWRLVEDLLDRLGAEPRSPGEGRG